MTVGFCCFWLLLDDFDVFCAAEGEDDAGAFFLSIDFVLCGFPDVVVKEGGGGVCFSMAFFFLSVFSIFSAFFIFPPSSPSSLLLSHYVRKDQVMLEGWVLGMTLFPLQVGRLIWWWWI